MAATDICDDLTNRRGYKDAMSYGKILQHIEDNLRSSVYAIFILTTFMVSISMPATDSVTG